MDFEERVVVFMDVLGARNAIMNGDQALMAALHDIIATAASGQRFSESMHESADENRETTTHPTVTSFSDCVVVSSATTNATGCEMVLALATKYWDCWLDNGFLGRGGATVGQLVHRNGVVFGPALVEAYELEAKTAVYPRINGTDALIETMKQLDLSPELYFRRDEDELWCLEVGNFEFFCNTYKFEDSIFYGEDALLQNTRDLELRMAAANLREMVIHLLNETSGNPKHHSKIKYATRHLNVSNGWDESHPMFIDVDEAENAV